MPKISIVMPIFNAGEQLFKTLSSIMGQKENDFEVLMIDDCSDDNATKEIEDTFVRFDSRFKLIKRDKHEGAAMCRNHGLKIATGKYLIFLDSDDFFGEDLLIEMSQSLDESGADVCVANFLMLDIVSHEKSFIYSAKKAGITDRTFNIKELGKDGLEYWMPVPWNKMFRKAFLIANNIEFQNLKNCNDLYFGLISIIKANKITLCRNEKPLLIYRVNNVKQISYDMDSRNMVRAYELLFEKTNDEIIHEMLITGLENAIKPMILRCSNQQFNLECQKMAEKLLCKYLKNYEKGEV